MATFSNIGKTGYIFNNGVWYPLAGITDASANYSWTGTHTFSDDVTVNAEALFTGHLTVNAPFNFFTSAANRDSTLPSPVNGTIALVVEGAAVQLQHYYNGAWRIFGSNALLVEKTASYTIAIIDAGKTIEVNMSTNGTITIPVDSNVNFPIGTQIAFVRTGTGGVTFAGQTVGAETVNLLSKNSNKRIAAQYTQAIIVKRAANTWYLFGDLTA